VDGIRDAFSSNRPDGGIDVFQAKRMRAHLL
jgi:hypothetical protein